MALETKNGHDFNRSLKKVDQILIKNGPVGYKTCFKHQAFQFRLHIVQSLKQSKALKLNYIKSSLEQLKQLPSKIIKHFYSKLLFTFFFITPEFIIIRNKVL